MWNNLLYKTISRRFLIVKKTAIKSLSVLLCFLIIGSAFSGLFAYAAEGDHVSGSFTYTLDESNMATIKKLDSAVTGSVIIPQTIDGYPVIAIGESAFKNCTLITQLTFYPSIKSVKASFKDLTALERCYFVGELAQWCSVDFSGADCNPYSVTDKVYIDGRIITGINPSDIAGAERIGRYAFAGCSGLNYVELPGSVKTLDTGCFYNCENLTYILLEGVETINSSAFGNCNGIKEIQLPASVSSVADGAFSHCKNIEHIGVDEHNPVIKACGDCLIKDDTLILGCKNSVIPADMGIKTIASLAFSDCVGLERIDIPEGVVSIGTYSFWYETTTIELYRLSKDRGAFLNCVNLREVNLPESLTYICGGSFRGCSSLKEITLPKNLKHIGYAAFANCTSLETFIYNAESVERVNTSSSGFFDSVFENDSLLKNLVFGKAVRVIPKTLFNDLASVDTITLYNTVETIDDKSFDGTDKYSKINFYGTPEEWLEKYNKYFDSTSYVRDIYYLAGTCEKTDDPTDVTVRYEYGTFGTPNDSELNLVVEDINANDSRFSSFKAIIDGNQYALYAIHMTDNDNNDMQPVEENQVNIKIPVPAGVSINAYSSVYIHHRKADGTTERKKYSTGDLLIEDGYFIFDVGSFSEFAICVDDGGEHVDSDGDHICDICSESLTYSAKLIIDGKTYDIIYHYGDTVIENLPEVPEKAGYTGEWEYTVNGSDLDIKPVYTPITYYATFVADGIQVGDKIPFTVEDKSITEPAVPEKEGHSGKWSAYTLAACDITVTAVYEESHSHTYSSQITKKPSCTEKGERTFTCSCGDSYKEEISALGHSFTNYKYNNDATTEKDGTETAKCDRCDATDTRTAAGTRLKPDSPVNPTAGAKINVAGTATLSYRTKVTVRATASNLDRGYSLVLVVNGKEYRGNNVEVSSDEFELKSDVNYYVKIVDSGDQIQKDASGNELRKVGTIKCNAGFFQKIIAFFQGLFNALPEKKVQP